MGALGSTAFNKGPVRENWKLISNLELTCALKAGRAKSMTQIQADLQSSCPLIRRCCTSTHGQDGQGPNLILSPAVSSATSQVPGLLKSVEKASITLLLKSNASPQLQLLKSWEGPLPRIPRKPGSKHWEVTVYPGRGKRP